ncbi:MAG: ankyrin repeat domain-containing protein, partial [Bacteroidota bacterium]
HGNIHPSVATTLHILADTYYSLNQLHKVLECYEKALEIYQQLSEGDPESMYASVANNLACMYHVEAISATQKEQNQAAQEHMKKAKKTFELAIASNDTPTASLCTEYANFLLATEQPEEAYQHLRQAIIIGDHKSGLSYSMLERETVTPALREKISQDNPVSVRAIDYAYYLLIHHYEDFQTAGINPEKPCEAYLADFQEAVEQRASQEGKEREDVIAVYLLESLKKSMQVREGSIGVNTPLHSATYNDNLSIVKIFINKGAKMDLQDSEGKTALHIAAYNGHLEVVESLAGKGAQIDVRDEDGNTPLHGAAYNGHLEVVKFLAGKDAQIDVRDEDGNTPLHIAAYNGHLEVAEYLYREGASIEVPNKDKVVPIHMAAQEGHLKVVEFLVDKGAQIDVRDVDGNTPLHSAAYNGHLEVVKFLHRKRASIDTPNNDKATPIYMAKQRDYLEVVEFLHREGAQIDMSDEDEIFHP